jgi:spermidine/putrescine transport system substrate-binding protein
MSEDSSANQSAGLRRQAGVAPMSRRAALAGGAALAVAATVETADAQRARRTQRATVNFYNWDTYIGETTLDDFHRATGAPVNMTLFASNDELFARLRAGNPGFDVIVPSNECVSRLEHAGMLERLDHSLIPNRANLLPEFQDAPFDPGRRFSMPYTWLVIGIGYRKSAMPDGLTPNSWRYLLDAAQFSGRIALASDSGDVARVCAKYLGLSLNGLGDADLVAIERLLIRQKPHIARFHDDDGQDLLVSGEVDVVMEYNGDLANLMCQPEGGDLGFVVPDEGSLMIADCLCIPKGAQNIAGAHAFINHLLDAETGKGISETILYPTPNRAARDLMPVAYRDSAVIFPSADIINKCEYGAFEGEARMRRYEDILMRVIAA